MKKHIPILIIFILFLYGGVCFGAASVMVIANKAQTEGAMSVKSPAVKSAVQRVASFFTDKGAGVFDEEAMEDIYGEIEQSGKIDIDMPENLLIALALKHKAEILVKLEVFTIPSAPGDETVSCRAISKMFNVSNGRLLSMSEQYGSNLIPSRQAYDSAIIAASSKAGGSIGKTLYEKLEKNHPNILERIIRTDIPEYKVFFIGFTQKENDIILDIVYDGIGLNEKSIKEKKVSPGFVELEIFTEKNFQRICRKLRQSIEGEGIRVGNSPITYDSAKFIKEGFDSDKLPSVNIR
ncbi:MAG: hypothetical protein HQK76_10465 [Desulfobacterales bacterium]|nr:hypothetical protein [Desulfobacterales bacterium]